MAVTTTRSGFQGLNQETQGVINYMTGVRTKKQIVGEFFGLREEAIYDDDGEKIIDFINDFKDTKELEVKGVHYHPNLTKLGVSKVEFDKLFYGEKVDYGKTKQGSTNGSIKKAKK